MNNRMVLFIVCFLGMNLLLRSSSFGNEEPKKKDLLLAQAVWKMKYDGKLDGQIDKNAGDARWRLVVRNNRVSGNLATSKENDPNDHRMAGEIVEGKPPILMLRQDGPGGLVCYYSGVQKEENRIVGTWFDNRGSSGDFEMVPESK